MAPNIYNPPVSKYMKSIGDIRGARIGRVIGNEGNVFNRITDNDTDEIEIYGDGMKGILHATRKLATRIPG